MDLERIRSNMAEAQSWVVWRVLKRGGVEARFHEIRRLCNGRTLDKVAVRFRRINMLSTLWQKLRSLISFSKNEKPRM